MMPVDEIPKPVSPAHSFRSGLAIGVAATSVFAVVAPGTECISKLPPSSRRFR